MNFFAHSLRGRPEFQWEPLGDHLKAVGRTAGLFAAAFGAEPAARCMGQLHDIGKMSAAYQAYIRAGLEAGGPRGPDHSTAGAIEAIAAYGDRLGRLLAYGVAGHHAGLMDFEDLERRRLKSVEDYQGWEDHAGARPSPDEIASMPYLKTGATRNGVDGRFSASFLGRMLFSCLVDADFIETERFYARAEGDAEPKRGGVFELHHLEQLRTHLHTIRRMDTALNRKRSEILDHANAKADLEPGLFTLTVPTGGGKTLTSLSFAAEHAVRHGLHRIIYVIPYTSIIEQTAEVFRSRVGLGDAVLEHHSGFDWDEARPGDGGDTEGEGRDGRAKLRRDSENWDSPLVVTTAVQFFESLFADRPSRARKLHNIAGSVVVLDEVQSLPVHLLWPCLAALDELAKNYRVSVVLCTATQPALRVQDGALPLRQEGASPTGMDIPASRELAPDPPALYEQFKRVAVEWRREPVSDAEITARFAEQPQMLCIVNSRAHARELFARVREQGQPGVVHLSTLMCAQHRRAVLEKLRFDLKDGRPVRLVSTSLIEAGVDIDFPEVWRAATGLASIAQAAGRCNREGALDGLGRTVVFEPEGRKIPPQIEAFYSAARPVFRSRPDDLLSLEAISDFYQELYWRKDFEELDQARLPDGEKLAVMKALCERTDQMAFQYGRAARAFRMIEDVMEPVIIPYDDRARSMISALHQAPVPPAGVQRTLQHYVASVPAASRHALLLAGVVQCIRPDLYGDRFAVLTQSHEGTLPELYDEGMGLRLDLDPAMRASESNVF